jgi:hypothetical protein
VTEAVDCQAAWRDYRRRRTIYALTFVLGLPATWIGPAVFNASSSVRAAVGATWLVSMVLATIYSSFFPLSAMRQDDRGRRVQPAVGRGFHIQGVLLGLQSLRAAHWTRARQRGGTASEVGSGAPGDLADCLTRTPCRARASIPPAACGCPRSTDRSRRPASDRREKHCPPRLPVSSEACRHPA